MVDQLPHVNATLNSLATILLVSGYISIKRGKESLHKRMMLACFVVSMLFLTSYLTYHYFAGHQSFPRTAPRGIRTFYLAILTSHIILAAVVPLLAVATIVLGLLDRRAVHRRLAKWTFPIWLYVSVTGIVVYVMLYQVYEPVLAHN